MVKKISVSYLAYVCLLLAFVALGLFVYALAAGSSLAGVAGFALVAFLTAAGAGFRHTVRDGEPEDALARSRIDRYLSMYRDGSSSSARNRAIHGPAGSMTKPPRSFLRMVSSTPSTV